MNKLAYIAVIAFAVIGAATAQSLVITPGGAINRIPKFTTRNTINSSSIVDVAGRIGIGTSAPVAPLHVWGNGPSLNIDGNLFPGIWFRVGGQGHTVMQVRTDGGGLNGAFDFGTYVAAAGLNLLTGGVRRLSVTPNGDVHVTTGQLYVRGQLMTPGARGDVGPKGDKGEKGDPGPQGPVGAGRILHQTKVINYTSSRAVDLYCDPGYNVSFAVCKLGDSMVTNDQTTPLPPGSTSWRNWLIPDASSATGVHCSLAGVAQQNQAQIRCSRVEP